ncbi:unnamed protein product [Brachionus calyciflorus]|uniref:Uncharacterized protein n=1 Tax=Brachionus calyciflorus TaxID=104777 RepID=A0A813V3I5_9BILA|nr:unnamed protein product [Brachionus calyciflorus]
MVIYNLLIILISFLNFYSTNPMEFDNFSNMNQSCSKTWSFFEKSMNISKISRADFIKEEKLKICDFPQSTCCNQAIEQRLVYIATKNIYKTQLLKQFSPIRTSLIDFASNFDTIVKESFENSYYEFTLLFNTTETISLDDHNRIFYQFYEGIKNYFSEYQLNLREILLKTFSNLFKVMVKTNTENSESNYNDNCFLKNLEIINPFGADILTEMESQLKVCLESVKLFNSGLTKARDIALEFYSKLENPSEECFNLFTSITTCSMCNTDDFFENKIFFKPCFRTCINVFKKCYSVDLSKFESLWDTFLSLMSKLAFNIEYTINFQNTVNEIKYHLLDGIAYFKTNKFIINNELEERCGKTTHDSNTKKKRRVKPIMNVLQIKRDVLNPKMNLHKFFVELTDNFSNLKGFWKSLISKICRSISPKSESDYCWNGSDFKKNRKDLEPHQLKIKSNKEIVNKNTEMNKTVYRQIETLKFLTNKLNRYVNKNFMDKNNNFYKKSNEFINHKALERNLKNFKLTKSAIILDEYSEEFDEINNVKGHETKRLNFGFDSSKNFKEKLDDNIISGDQDYDNEIDYYENEQELNNMDQDYEDEYSDYSTLIKPFHVYDQYSKHYKKQLDKFKKTIHHQVDKSPSLYTQNAVNSFKKSFKSKFLVNILSICYFVYNL